MSKKSKYEVAIDCLKAKLGLLGQAKKSSPVEIKKHQTAVANGLVEAGVFDDDTLKTASRETLLTAGVPAGVVDWFRKEFVSTETPPATPSASTGPIQVEIKQALPEVIEDLSDEELLKRLKPGKQGPVFQEIVGRCHGQACMVYDGETLLIEPTLQRMAKAAKGRPLTESVQVGDKILYPRKVTDPILTKDEDLDVSPFFPTRPLDLQIDPKTKQERQIDETSGADCTDILPATRTILILAQTVTYEQTEFRPQDVYRDSGSYTGNEGLTYVRRWYPRAGKLFDAGSVVDLKRPARSFREPGSHGAKSPLNGKGRDVEDDSSSSPPPPPALPDRNNPFPVPPLAKKVFIISSQADAKWLERLHVSLAQLRRAGVEITDNLNMSPGCDRDATITNRLVHASVVVLLMSADLFAEDGPNDLVNKAFRYEKKFAPVLLRPCSSVGSPLDGRAYVPKQAISISSDVDSAFSQVVTTISKMVNS